MQSRYYNPEWARFLNADAILGRAGELLSHNIFSYCFNNPINLKDDTGFMSFSVTDSGPSGGTTDKNVGDKPIGGQISSGNILQKIKEFKGILRTKFISNGKGNVINANVGNYLSQKAPNQVTPGTRELTGQYIDDLGKVQPWKAYYDEYGRLIARTDYNAGNLTQGIPVTHYHLYEWGPGKTPYEYGKHIKGEYKP